MSLCSYCSAIAISENPLVQVGEKLLLNSKQNLEVKRRQAEKVTFEADISGFSFFKRDSLVSITWWSLSFSSYMILCTSLLLSFFTICTSAAVDKSWSKNTNERVYVKITDWYMIATLELWGKWMLLHTWTRLSVSRRKLKSPNTKKGSTVCRLSDILEK